jgi:hypothetical protein
MLDTIIEFREFGCKFNPIREMLILKTIIEIFFFIFFYHFLISQGLTTLATIVATATESLLQSQPANHCLEHKKTAAHNKNLLYHFKAFVYQ